MWLTQSVNKLVEYGHDFRAIGDYTLTQFMASLQAIEQNEASERLNFVSDLSVVVGSLFSKDSPISDHIASLVNISVGVKTDGDQSQ